MKLWSEMMKVEKGLGKVLLHRAVEKACFRETREPTRETRALPTSCTLSYNLVISVGGNHIDHSAAEKATRHSGSACARGG